MTIIRNTTAAVAMLASSTAHAAISDDFSSDADLLVNRPTVQQELDETVNSKKTLQVAGYYSQWSTVYVPECSYQYVFTGYGYVYQWACF